MVVLTSEIDKEPHLAMLFADDLILCETSKAAVEREREREREREVERERETERERTGDMARPIRKTWTESQPCNDYDNNSRNYEEIQLGDDKLNTVTTFKYLGSIFDSNGGAERDINNRVKLAYMKLGGCPLSGKSSMWCLKYRIILLIVIKNPA